MILFRPPLDRGGFFALFCIIQNNSVEKTFPHLFHRLFPRVFHRVDRTFPHQFLANVENFLACIKCVRARIIYARARKILTTTTTTTHYLSI